MTGSSPRQSRITWRPGPSLATFLIAFVAYALVSLLKLYLCGSGADLQIFHQAILNLSRFHAPTVPIKGAGENIFGDHFHPVILACVPAYWLYPHPATLLVVQAATVALAGAILCRWAPGWPSSGSRREALAGVFAPGVASGVLFDFHEVALGAPVLVAFLCALFRRSTAPWAIPLLGAACLLIKEDTALYVVGAGLYLLLSRRFAMGLGLVAMAGTWLLVVTRWIIPSFNSAGVYTYSGSASISPATVMVILRQVVSPLFLATLVVILLSSDYRRLVARRLVVTVPTLAAYLSAGNFRYLVLGYHYYVLPSLAVWCCLRARSDDGARDDVAGDDVAGDDKRGDDDGPVRAASNRWIRAAAFVVGYGAVVAVNLHNTPVMDRTAAARAIAEVPPGTVVAAEPQLLTRFPNSVTTLILRPPRLGDSAGRQVPGLDWVVVDVATKSFGGPAWVQPYVQSQLTSFRVTAVHGDYRVLCRVGAPTCPAH